jgi:hypothetical protein
MSTRLSLAEPHLTGNERAYVLDCIDSNWISSIGTYIPRFEDAFAEFATRRRSLSARRGSSRSTSTDSRLIWEPSTASSPGSRTRPTPE